MNLPVLCLAFLRRRRLSGLLSVCLLGFGLGTIDAVLLFSHQLREGLEHNIGGIDLVVGSKGSPLQLILSSVFQADAPTGNIPLEEAREIAARRGVRQAIPMALGDSYRSRRIVGTRPSYADLYEAELEEGRWWTAPLEVVVGHDVAAEIGLSVGDTFASVHGFESEGHSHEEPLLVVGVLGGTGAVVDRLILTSVETVWHVHGIHEEHEDEAHDHPEHDGDAHDHHDHEGHAHGHDEHEGEAHDHDEHEGEAHDHHEHEGEAHDHHEHEGEAHDHHEHTDKALVVDVLDPNVFPADELELTALLIQYRSPVAAATFPTRVNRTTNLQAASPAFETARLFSLIGVGVDTLRAFGILLACGALLGVFVLLHEQLSDLRQELGVLRLLGVSKGKLLGIVILQGIMLGAAGSVCGLVLGHLGLAGLNTVLSTSGLGLSGALVWLPSELGVLVAGPILGAGAAFIPAWRAYRTQISPVLAGD